jgi:hypothetical protein
VLGQKAEHACLVRRSCGGHGMQAYAARERWKRRRLTVDAGCLNEVSRELCALERWEV